MAVPIPPHRVGSQQAVVPAPHQQPAPQAANAALTIEVAQALVGLGRQPPAVVQPQAEHPEFDPDVLEAEFLAYRDPATRIEIMEGVKLYPAEVDALYAGLLVANRDMSTGEKVQALMTVFEQYFEEVQVAEHMNAEPNPNSVKISDMIDRTPGARDIKEQVEDILQILDTYVPNITHMDLSGLGLTELPTFLSVFSKITHLDLSHNSLKTITYKQEHGRPLEPVFSDTVKELILAHNEITGRDEDWGHKLPAMPQLVRLDLSQNKFAAPIQFTQIQRADEATGAVALHPGAPNLQFLHFDNNPIFTSDRVNEWGEYLIDHYVFDTLRRDCPQLTHISVSQGPGATLAKLLIEKFPGYVPQQMKTLTDPNFVLLTKAEPRAAPNVRVRLPRLGGANRAASPRKTLRKKMQKESLLRSPGARGKRRPTGSPKGRFKVQSLSAKAQAIVRELMDEAREAHLMEMGLGRVVQEAPAPVMPHVEGQPLRALPPMQQEQQNHEIFTIVID